MIKVTAKAKAKVRKCCKCESEAEFTLPKNFCFKHWAAWWFAYDIATGKMTEEQAVAKAGKERDNREKDNF